MPSRKLLVIICTTSGKQESIKSAIKQQLDDAKEPYRFITIATPPDLAKRVAKLKLDEYTAVAAYGGDGTIVAALNVLRKHKIPLLILPGGTANVLAKYFGMPSTVLECLDLYIRSTYITSPVELATINDEPLVLDMHMGLWTYAIKNTPRESKRRLGESAYAWSAIKRAAQAPLQTYEFSLNGQASRTVQGYTLLVVNQGNHNILGLPLFPHNHAPGLVQLALVKSVNPLQLIRWFIVRLIGKNLQSIIEVHRARTVEITKAPRSILSDDDDRKVDLPIRIEAGQFTTRILVPPTQSNTSRAAVWWHRLKQSYFKYYHRFRSFTYIGPSLRHSHVGPGLYLGGKYSRKHYKLLRSWGVTGVVSMRRATSPPTPADIELLNLPTPDWHPPTLTDLQKGVDFITKHIDNGGGAYVHCQLGEGRGPTMAAAYLITKGFSVEEAIQTLTNHRPVVQPNAAQRKRLAEWQEHYNSESK